MEADRSKAKSEKAATVEAADELPEITESTVDSFSQEVWIDHYSY